MALASIAPVGTGAAVFLPRSQPAMAMISRTMAARILIPAVYRNSSGEASRVGRRRNTQEKAWVRRLVIADVLGGNREAILRIMHQGGDAVLGGNARRVNAQGVVVGGAEDDFFPPIAEEIGAED